jgi:hypothetical protein
MREATQKQYNTERGLRGCISYVPVVLALEKVLDFLEMETRIF